MDIHYFLHDRIHHARLLRGKTAELYLQCFRNYRFDFDVANLHQPHHTVCPLTGSHTYFQNHTYFQDIPSLLFFERGRGSHQRIPRQLEETDCLFLTRRACGDFTRSFDVYSGERRRRHRFLQHSRLHLLGSRDDDDGGIWRHRTHHHNGKNHLHIRHASRLYSHRCADGCRLVVYA